MSLLAVRNFRRNLYEDKRYARCLDAALGVLVFVFFLLWILPVPSMVDASGDSGDIWKAITTLHTGEMQYSYVLYKGVMSVYPYTWLYRLSLAFGTDAFLFIKLYHAILFTYIAVWGIPGLIHKLFSYKPLLWQRVALALFLFYTWRPTQALHQLMVDLPSCAFFIVTVNLALLLGRAESGKRRMLLGALMGAFAGLCASISGQFSLPTYCLVAYVVIKLFGKKTRADKTLLWQSLLSLFLLFFAMSLSQIANLVFTRTVIEPMLLRIGTHLVDNTYWLERGLIYMLGIGRNFMGHVTTPRGFAMLEDYYGVEVARELMEKATLGLYGWTVPEYFRFIVTYPAETLSQYFDRGFLAITTDQGCLSLPFMLLGYSFFYLALLTAVRHNKRIKDFFRAEILVMLAVCASIVPLLVLSVEMRTAIAFQGIVLGIGLAGPILPEIYHGCKAALSKWKRKEVKISEMNFPWALLIYLVFIAVCLTHISTLYSTGDSATMLFSYSF